MGMEVIWILVFLISNLCGFTHEAEVISLEQSGWNEYLNCDAVKISPSVGCICISGLWRLYGDCTSFATVAGNSLCLDSRRVIPLQRIHYAREILPKRNSIALVRANTDVVRLECHDEAKKQVVPVSSDDRVVTGGPHTLFGKLGIVCIHPFVDSYCYYNVREFIGAEILNVTMGCNEEVPILPSASCHQIRGSQSCNEAEGVEIDMKDALGTLPGINDVPSGDLRRKKRFVRTKFRALHGKTSYGRGAFNGKTSFGRTFLGAPGQQLDNKVDTIDADDEDYIPTDELQNLTTSSSDTVLSEVWNSIENQAEIVMGIRKPLQAEIDYGIPLFRLLHKAKKVMQKTCPVSYVPPSFFDLAVQSFIQIQMKRFGYEETNSNLPGFHRIMKALENCVEKAEPYPFITPDVGGNLSCNTSIMGKGFYTMFNTSLEMAVSNSFVGRDRDPMIETTWKIFDAAQAYCYPYFDVSSFNDHHRFIAWMLPLFQNEILPVWLNGSATNLTYGQFLGDMDSVMERVAYCSASTRFTGNNNTYPWELNRPGGSNSDSGGDVAAAAPSSRKRRNTEFPLTSCLNPEESGPCFTTAREAIRNHGWKSTIPITHYRISELF